MRDLTLWNLRSLPMFVRHEFYERNIDTVHLMRHTVEARIKERSSVEIRLYRLPAGKAAFLDELKFWLRYKRGFKLAGGTKFSAEMLALQDLPEAYQHHAFQTRSSRTYGRIIHVYEAPHRALIVAYGASSLDFLKNDMFNYVVQNLRIGPARPRRLPPAPKPKPQPRPPEPQPTGSDRPLNPKEEKEVACALGEAFKFLELDEERTSSDAVQDAIYEAINRILEGKARLTRKRLTDMSVNLGCLWGKTVCDALGWQWCFATIDGNSVYAIASRNRSHLIPPLHFIEKQLKKKGTEEDNTSLLLYNMLKAKSFPAAKPKSYCVLG